MSQADALIMIVDDEPDLVAALEFALKRAGFRLRVAHTGGEALLGATREPLPDLILLDLMLPDIQGPEVFERLRSDARTRDIPVIMLTARSSEVDRIAGFEQGADDYVIKPFSSRELVLRIRAVLRRVRPSEPDPGLTDFGLIRVDPSAHRVWVEGEEKVLTALEFRLLQTFIDRRGRVQRRETLLSEVWDIQAPVHTRTVDTHVKRLRKKLGPAGAYIRTIRGVGYRFRSSPEEA